MATTVPRNKLKAILKNKTKTQVKTKPAADALLELAVQLFLRSVAVEARINAFEDRSATTRACHVKAAAKNVLKKSRG